MRNLNDTITRLSALRARTATGVPQGGSDRLEDLLTFGSNPGALRARCFVPEGLGENAPLVVVLHGCTQTAAGYDLGSGWSQLAEDHGFAVLFPEQQRSNNPNLCFNWFNPEDTRRGAGEALSIRQMVETMVAAHHLDPARVYVTGLSAGGAMASMMLATYPEVFAGGAIIAGLPFGTAASIPEAFDRMRGSGGPNGVALGALVRAASSHQGPWPTVSVWHGSADATVAHANAALIIEQWRQVHGLPPEPSATENVAGHTRRVWRGPDGRDAVEEYRIAGMGHGTPLSMADEDPYGAVGPFMLEAGISSTRHIADFWGLTGLAGKDRPKVRQAEHPGDLAATPISAPAAKRTETPEMSVADLEKQGGVKKVIEDALRAAGLMR